jgi:hypothetical protein
VLLAGSIFVTPTRLPERIWAIDLACRSPGVAVVIADGSGVGMSESRRLQLAACSGNTLCLLARPWSEHKEISAAWTRWRVMPAVSDTAYPKWDLTILRCKGSQNHVINPSHWTVERDHETGHVRLVPEIRDRRRETAFTPTAVSI